MIGVVKTETAAPLQSKSLAMFMLFVLINGKKREDRLQRGYIELAKVLPWLHETLAKLDHEESEDMLRKVCLNMSPLVTFVLICNLAQARRGLSSWR